MNKPQRLTDAPLLNNGRVYDGTGEGEIPKNGCYVFTAFHGKNEGVINSLRMWRDEALVNGHKAKTVFIKLYYRLLANPGGRLLRKFKILKPVSRQMIFLFVRINGIKVQEK